jgi:H+-translocating NAD(P) transhydrogenase subunit beta
MSIETLPNVAYLVAAVLFIRSLGGLSNQETARRGNLLGIIGMIIAMAATTIDKDVLTVVRSDGFGAAYNVMIGAVVIGFAIGAFLAVRVVMTAMPQLVALLHSFVGLAAVLVGISTWLAHPNAGAVHQIEVWLGVAIGAITFTGSIIAWGKLRGSLSGRPLILPARHLLNAVTTGAIVFMAVPFMSGAEGLDVANITSSTSFYLLIGMSLLAGLLGIHLVMSIGGADMPVVVSLLNSYSGWAAAATGFMLENDLLIIIGALVGSSGAILSFIMCKAMNRSIWNVVFGGFGANAGKQPAPSGDGPTGTVTETDVAGLTELALNARSIFIIPGYGMAVARAQHLVREMATMLRDNGAKVSYVIHPVAGRLPGHMNVLLAEAGVPYDTVFEMDEVNDDCPDTDLVIVIGANDIVNPGAETDESSPIYGMPVIQAWKAGTVVVLKRSLGAGYAGVGNPLFYNDNTEMLFGDARETIQGVVAALRG